MKNKSKNLNEIISEEEFNSNSKFKNSKFSIKTNKKNKIHLSDKPKLTVTSGTKLGFKYAMLVLWSIIVLYPIITLIIQSFNGRNGNNSISTSNGFEFSSKPYSDLGPKHYWDWVVNSLVISVATMVIVVFLVGLLGYAYSRFRFSGKKTSLVTFLLLRMIPTISSLIVFYVLAEMLATKFGLGRQYTLVLVYSGGGVISNLFLIKGYMDNISTEIDDSAKMEGLGNWKLYWRMIVPLSKPMLSIIAFWSFIGPFGDVIISNLIISDEKNYTVAIGLRTLISGNASSQNYPAFLAGGVIVAVPSILVFISMQKNLVSGLSDGAVKG